MQIIYGYSNCTESKYNEIIRENNVSVLQPDQKYHSLLIKGLSKNVRTIKCISGLPINRSVTSKKFICEKDEVEDNVHYHYIVSINMPILRQLMIFFGTFFSVLKIKKDNNTYAIYDCLNLANAYGMVLACKLKGIPISAIVTDLPDIERNSSILRMLNNYLFTKTDGFILLTELMNDVINVNKRPYIVLEGHVDSDLLYREVERYEEKGNGIIIYAGNIKKLYGIQNLVEGFIKANLSNVELRVYGDGDYRKELETITKNHMNVTYMGVKSNAEVVNDELRASLLVNPRPISPEYTKYSFPSKNMEYMVSGTPVLTTKLPGMPKEYYPYVYLIEDETSDGIAQTLKDIFNEPLSQRNNKGAAARAFVLENKSNVKQAGKIIDFLNSEVC